MSNFKGVNINRSQGGLGRSSANTDAVMALVIPADYSTTELTENKAYEFYQIEDAEVNGLNESFDANTETLVYYHLQEFFRLAPEGMLYFIPVESGMSLADMPEIINPILRGLPEVKIVGIAGTSEKISEMPNLVNVIQEGVVNTMFAEHRYIDALLIEGNGANETFATVGEFPNLREQNGPQVSVIIGQDPSIAESDNAYAGYAAVGSALGMLAVRKVNENLGSVNIQNKPATKRSQENYPLTSTTRWATAALSTGKGINELSYTDYQTLADKGYILAGAYNGYAGIYFNGSATCVDLSSDYAYIENNRVWNKAARIIRQTLLAEVKGLVKKDASTGFIKSTTISRWTGLLNAGVEQMMIDDEISGFEVYINPKQYLNNDEPLKVKVRIVKDDIVHEFDVDLGLVNKTTT